MLKVKQIENGTVIDHIAAGKGLEVLHILPHGNAIIVLAMNVPSSKFGKKDILKLENFELKEKAANIISLISPNATVNIIRNSSVAQKYNVQLPAVVKGLIKCMNPKCITNTAREPAESEFRVTKNPLTLRCKYCEHEFGPELISATHIC